jgi:hypothetical protein
MSTKELIKLIGELHEDVKSQVRAVFVRLFIAEMPGVSTGVLSRKICEFWFSFTVSPTLFTKIRHDYSLKMVLTHVNHPRVIRAETVFISTYTDGCSRVYVIRGSGDHQETVELSWARCHAWLSSGMTAKQWTLTHRQLMAIRGSI